MAALELSHDLYGKDISVLHKSKDTIVDLVCKESTKD